MIRILIADDHPVVRHGLKQILSTELGDVGFGEASTSEQVLDAFRQESWDLVILDLNMPGIGGLALLTALKRLRPQVPVLVLSFLAEEQYALRVLRAGAAGYLSKESAAEELAKAVARALKGGRYVSTMLAEKLAFEPEAGTEAPPYHRLSAREFQVLCKIASGRTVGQIAQELGLSAKTVSTYRSRVLNKMKMKTNAELIHYAIKNRLLDGPVEGV